jgi:hypothetical protein
MAKVVFNGRIFEGKEIKIEKGKIFVDDIDMGIVGFQLCVEPTDAEFDQSEEGVLRWT